MKNINRYLTVNRVKAKLRSKWKARNYNTISHSRNSVTEYIGWSLSHVCNLSENNLSHVKSTRQFGNLLYNFTASVWWYFCVLVNLHLVTSMLFLNLVKWSWTSDLVLKLSTFFLTNLIISKIYKFITVSISVFTNKGLQCSSIGELVKILMAFFCKINTLLIPMP